MAKTVMVVDDDAGSLTRSKEVLAEKYSVWTFKSGYKALGALCGGVTPQLILCGFQLADMDGSEFKARLRKERLEPIPFVYLIAFSERQSLAGEECLFKPFGRLELLELIDRHLAVPSRF
jgi:CheY-like chemotaxis protein